MVQEQSLPEPRRLEDLLLCSAKACAPDFIDRNFCFRLISPTTEHLFQALSEHDMQEWMGALQEAVEEAIKNQDHGVSGGGQCRVTEWRGRGSVVLPSEGGGAVSVSCAHLWRHITYGTIIIDHGCTVYVKIDLISHSHEINTRKFDSLQLHYNVVGSALHELKNL